ncbi:Cofactor assembly of complex C subunit B [Fragilaria crotonensis]|nr:Cofactor assembly of complex C subunit B [Fragilaria crotonensis]
MKILPITILLLLKPTTTYGFSKLPSKASSRKLFDVIRPTATTTSSTVTHAPNSSTCLFQEKPGGSARFTGIQSQDATSALDLVLRAIVSDIGSIVIGLVGLGVAVVNRLANDELQTVDALGQETRTDLLAVFACGAVLLNGLSKLDVTSALAQSVVLDGVSLEDTIVFYTNSYPKDLPWALKSLLAATPAKTALLLEYTLPSCWKTVAVAGIVPREERLRLGTSLAVNPIVDSFLQSGSTKEKYLPTLQALPGRVEFTYLPSNTQEALLLPVSSTQVLVLGSNTAKSFSPRDIAWSQVIASRLGATSTSDD